MEIPPSISRIVRVTDRTQPVISCIIRSSDAGVFLSAFRWQHRRDSPLRTVPLCPLLSCPSAASPTSPPLHLPPTLPPSFFPPLRRAARLENSRVHRATRCAPLKFAGPSIASLSPPRTSRSARVRAVIHVRVLDAAPRRGERSTIADKKHPRDHAPVAPARRRTTTRSYAPCRTPRTRAHRVKRKCCKKRRALSLFLFLFFRAGRHVAKETKGKFQRDAGNLSLPEVLVGTGSAVRSSEVSQSAGSAERFHQGYARNG